jgi:hypothetical protein
LSIGGLVLAQDLATAVCGATNAAYFASYWWRREESRGRRAGAAALTLVSVAAVIEAGFSQGQFWALAGAGGAGEMMPLWAVARLPLLAATAFISLLILRRLGP